MIDQLGAIKKRKFHPATRRTFHTREAVGRVFVSKKRVLWYTSRVNGEMLLTSA